jgi:hypothetical protein
VSAAVPLVASSDTDRDSDPAVAPAPLRAPAGPSPSRRTRTTALVAIGAVVLLALGAIALLTRGGDGKGAATVAASSDTTTSSSAPEADGAIADVTSRDYNTTIHYRGMAITLSKVEIKPFPDKTQMDATVAVKNEGVTDVLLNTGTTRLKVDQLILAGDTTAISNLVSGEERTGKLVFFAPAAITVDFDRTTLVFGSDSEAAAVIPLGSQGGLVDNRPLVQAVSGTLTSGPDTITLERVVAGPSLNLSKQAPTGKAFVEVDFSATFGADFDGAIITVYLTLPDGSSAIAFAAGTEQEPACAETLVEDCLNGLAPGGRASLYFEVPARYGGHYTFNYGSVDADEEAEVAFDLPDPA